MNGWRAGGLAGWRAGGLAGWRAGGLAGWRAGGLAGSAWTAARPALGRPARGHDASGGMHANRMDLYAGTYRPTKLSI
jgi:hypothetical protein